MTSNSALRIVALSAAVLCAVWSGSALAQQTVTVPPSAVVSWSEMVASEARQAPAAGVRIPRVVPRMPGPPPRDIGTGGGKSQTVEKSAAVTAPAPDGPIVNTGFLALPDDNTSIPPDTHGAAGPGHLLTMLNTQVRIQNKSGGNLSTVSLTTFWTSGTGLSGDPFDPRVIYDSLSGRWIATADAEANSTSSQVWFAISATGDPTGSWTFYGFDADAGDTTWADFPGFGVNSTWIAITNNMFTVSGNPFFSGVKAWVIDKSTALAGGPLTTTVFPTGFDSNDGFALQPAVTFDAGEPALYIVDNGFATSNGTPVLRLSRFTGTGAAPSWSAVPGSTIAPGFFAVNNSFEQATIGAEQLGVPSTCDGGTRDGMECNVPLSCSLFGGKCRRVDTGDPRLASNAVFRNGRLWFAHTGGLPLGTVNRTAVFWYQVDPGAMPAPIVQSGVFDGGTGVHHYYPSIAVNANDDAYVGFSRSDAGRYIEAVGAGRHGTDPAGSMDPISVLKAGEGPYYKTFSGSKNRWGDYSATVVDPSDDITLWTLQEYARTGNEWGTWWTKLALSCGSGTLEGAEQCDDGDIADGDGCDSACTVEQCWTCSGTPSVCTPDDGVPCDDGSVCTPADLCSGGTCVGGGTPPDCDDGSICTQDSCDAVSGCVNAAVPAGGCLTPAKSVLKLRHEAPGDRDKLISNWINGPALTQAQLADPTSTDGYTLCVYHAAGLVLEAEVPPGGTCGSGPCWSAVGSSGYKYSDPASASDGTRRILLKGSDSATSKVKVKGQGTALPDAPLPLVAPVTTQLIKEGSSLCFETTFGSADIRVNDGVTFKARTP